MQMQLSSDVRIPDGILAANALLAENSHQGFGASTHTVYQGFGVAISSTALGIPGALYDGRIRCRCTGKERDTESGLDYFGARYYASNMGRFMSPDWASNPQAVPYASYADPQSLNLYTYMRNNPLGGVDPDGHWPGPPSMAVLGGTFISPATMRSLAHGFVKGLVNAINFIGGDCSCQAAVQRNTPMLTPNNGVEAAGMVLGGLATGPVTDLAFGGATTLTTSVPAAIETESVSSTALLSQAEDARDALAGQVGASKATVTGAYNSQTGEVTAAACGGGQCAEDVANGQLQGGATNFTKAIRPRTGNEVPICERCETTYGRDKFPSDAQFKSDQTKPPQ
jgi:RHS repeat-associated protein